MAQTVKLRRSATPSNVPTTGQLALGEFAVNTYDGKVYFKKDSGTPIIEQLCNASVTLTGGVGIASIGDLTDNRTVDLDLNGLTAESTVNAAADYLVMYDASAGAHRKVLIDDLPISATLDGLTDTSISGVTTGEVLKWDGTDWINNTLAEAGIAAASHAHDTSDITSGTFANARIAVGNVTQHEGSIDHNALTNYSANRHLDHTTITLTAGVGLTGGGTIAANRTFDMDVPGLTAEATVNGAVDYLVMYDASAGAHRKVLIDNLPGGGNLGDMDDVVITAPAADDHLTYDGANWTNSPFSSASSTMQMNSWTLLSGSLYYADHTHNLNTTAVSSFIYDTVTKKQVFPEYTEILDNNTFRVVVEGNTHDITCNVITGALGPPGPQGPAGGGMANVVEDTTPQLGGNLDLNTYSIIAAGPVTISTTEMSYLDGLTSNVQTQIDSHTHVAADVTDLGDAATRNTGMGSGNVLKVGPAGITPSEVLVSNVAGNAETETKATGFNLALGTTAGTVSEGNHTHVEADITDLQSYALDTHTHVDRRGHTWAISGEVKVPSGDTDFLIPFFVSMSTGQTAKIVKARHRINSGTSVTCKVQKNGVDVTGFTGISVTTTSTNTDPADVTLADDDALALVVTAVNGTPKNMTFTLFIEYTQ